MRLLVVLLFALSLLKVTAQNAWTQLNDFPFETAARDSFVFQGEAYVVTGFPFDGNDNEIYRYDSNSDSWFFVTTTPNEYLAPFVLDDLIYFLQLDGMDGSLNVWQYDLLENTWEQKTDAEEMFTSFGDYKPHTFVIDSIAYLVLPGDYTESGGGLTAKKYIPSEDIWVSIAPYIGTYDASVSSFVADGKAFTIFGTQDLGTNILNSMYAYDPNLDIWEEKTSPPIEFLGSPVILPFENEVYIGGGDFFGIPYPFFYRYSIDTDTWTQVEDPNYSVTRAFSFVINGAGFFGAGREFSTEGDDGYEDRKKVYRFDPEFLSVSDVSVNNLKLFPNPVQEILYIEGFAQAKSYTIYDLLGREVSVNSISNNEFDVSPLSSGVYFFLININGLTETHQFVKQ